MPEFSRQYKSDPVTKYRAVSQRVAVQATASKTFAFHQNADQRAAPRH
jgi:hypothetical protein